MKIKYILKSCIDELCSKGARLRFAESDDAVLLTPDIYVCYRIPKSEIPVDFPKSRKSLSLPRLWKDWHEALDSGSYRTATRAYHIDTPKGELMVYNENVCVIAKLLKGFNKNAEIRIRDPKEPVLVIEDGELVGVVYPTLRGKTE